MGSFQSLGGVFTSPPALVSLGRDDVSVFIFAVGSDQALWYVRLDGFAGEGDEFVWSDWQSLGGILVSPPHATMFGELDDLLLVFGVGTDHALWTRSLSLSTGVWSGWQSLGHRLCSPPFAVTWRKETFAVFALGTDSAIWYTMGSEWKSLGGTFATAPCAVSTFRHVHVFAADAQRALQHRAWDGSSWSDWESLGGIVMSPPTANNQQELIHVFGLGTDSAIWRRRWVGDSWSDWHSLGRAYLAPPGAIGRAGDVFPTRDLVALGVNHAVWHMEEDDP